MAEPGTETRKMVKSSSVSLSLVMQTVINSCPSVTVMLEDPKPIDTTTREIKLFTGNKCDTVELVTV